ncbi:MetQ/NlpA family ABC transporter substrate-binding protein [Carnimonas nigrificans]|uniref:MetQ/NlpA family ABC transporter substrate-binding protein n=1 Tax=Carnimonas nigrificans TaxID=64323 RepID=UPI00046F39CF|nr:MetQ/NlpA family ABC transporter substrate-binding protein [Carnimonas nigrificans]
MHRTIKGIALGAGALAITAFLSGCGSQSEDSNTVSVGVIAGPEEELMEVAKQIAKERYNLNVNIVEFNDYVAPNSALADGSIDTNAYQSQPYMDAMIKDRGLDLTAMPNGHTFIYPIGGYSTKHDSLSDLPDGATIAIPNDPANGARGLLILAKAGLIELNDPNNISASVDDITANPHHFKFEELEGPQIPRSLDDVDLAFINNTFAEPAGLQLSDALIAEDADSPYVNIFAVRKGDEENEKIRHLVDAFQTDDVAEKAHDLFGDGAIPGWK